MRVVVRRQEECVLCTAVKTSFCPILPEPYRSSCEGLVDGIAAGSEEAVRSFVSIRERVSPETFEMATARLREFLSEHGQ